MGFATEIQTQQHDYLFGAILICALLQIKPGAVNIEQE